MRNCIFLLFIFYIVSNEKSGLGGEVSLEMGLDCLHAEWGQRAALGQTCGLLERAGGSWSMRLDRAESWVGPDLGRRAWSRLEEASDGMGQAHVGLQMLEWDGPGMLWAFYLQKHQFFLSSLSLIQNHQFSYKIK